MRTVKQPPLSQICGACVVAMILDKPLEYVLKNSRGGDISCAYTCWMAEVLARHGVLMGTYLAVPNWEKGYRGDFTCSHGININLEGRPAVVGVDSDGCKGKLHWVFWDGEVFRDPNPYKPDTCPPNSYDGRIVDIYPLTFFEDTP